MKYSILIVDDEPGIRQSLTGVLQDEGYRAEAVASGEQCLEFLAKKKCDGAYGASLATQYSRSAPIH